MRAFTAFQITEIFNDYGKERDNGTHDVIVRVCDYCGKPMTASEANDYGTLCERCYMREYYNE